MEELVPGHDIIVVGGSAGGVEAAKELVGALPANLPAAVFVVVHISQEYPSILDKILKGAAKMPTAEAQDKDCIKHGHIYVACPGRHLVVERERIRVVAGPRENNVRPAIDVLFRTAARAYGPRVVGVILSGTLDDGTAGLLAIKRRGGIAIAQTPEEALFPGMPLSAIEHVGVDHIVPLAQIAPLIVQMASTPAAGEARYPISKTLEVESQIAEKGFGTMEELEQIGKVSHFTCPECHGTLWELHDGELLRFRCQTGHAYSLDALQNGQSDGLEAALWAALRSLEEQSELARRIAGRGRLHGNEALARRFERTALIAEQHAATFKQILAERDGEEPGTVLGDGVNSDQR